MFSQKVSIRSKEVNFFFASSLSTVWCLISNSISISILLKTITPPNCPATCKKDNAHFQNSNPWPTSGRYPGKSPPLPIWADNVTKGCSIFAKILFQSMSSYRVVSFNCSAQISVLKRKTLFNQGGSFVHREFYGTEYLIGCPSFFILLLKIERNS